MDLAGLPATEQKALLASGRASCRELLAACRTRAGLTEPVVNAIPTVDWEAAEALAGRLDDDTMLMEGAPLRGLVTAHKDLFDTAGMRTTYGSPVFADHVPAADTPLVAHLRRCGLVSVGKTNTPEFGKGSHTFNPVHGLWSAFVPPPAPYPMTWCRTPGSECPCRGRWDARWQTWPFCWAP